MAVTRDSRELHEARQHLHQASILAQVADDRKRGARRLRLGRDTGDKTIPAGAWVHFRPATLPAVRLGSLVLVRVGSDVRVRRLVRTSHASGSMVMHLGPPSGGSVDPALSPNHLLGEVLCVEIDGKTFQIQLAGGSPVVNWLTEFGTCHPAQKLARVLWGFVPARFRPKG